MPDLIGNDLVIGILHDKSDLCRLLPVAYFAERNTPEKDLPCALSVGRQHCFKMPQERTFAAAGLSAQYKKFSLFHLETDVFQRMPALGGGIGKGQIFDIEMRHWMASFMCNAIGISR